MNFIKTKKNQPKCNIIYHRIHTNLKMNKHNKNIYKTKKLNYNNNGPV